MGHGRCQVLIKTVKPVGGVGGHWDFEIRPPPVRSTFCKAGVGFDITMAIGHHRAGPVRISAVNDRGYR